MYALYFPDSGAYTKLMKLREARRLNKMFPMGIIVDHDGVAI